ncbi:MAG TPA: LuxR family transcriptional regulator [Bradyrhizobium sp.]|nr:LuxR family transcriptional regulator [Bradyrhizobium sp.]
MSRRSLDETLSFIAAVDRAGSAAAISETILSVVRPFGFSQVFAGIIPLSGMSAQQQVANVVLHWWPEQWSQRYFSHGYLFDDPTIQRIMTSTEPFFWSELEGSYRECPSAKRIMDEAKEFDLGFGFTVPMLTLDRQSAGFSIAGDRGELPPHYRGPLQLLTMYSFGRALSLADVPPPVKLTPREADVLQWIAEGKSDWEISKILHVSEHLVDKMARQIRTKFGAANRTQAVVQALRHRIIR